LVKQKHDAETATREDHERKVNELVAKLQGFEKSGKDADWEEAIRLGEGSTALYSNDDPSFQEITRILARARSMRQAGGERRQPLEALKEIEDSLGKPDGLTAQTLGALHRRLDDLAGKAQLVGLDFTDRLARARESLDRTFAAK